MQVNANTAVAYRDATGVAWSSCAIALLNPSVQNLFAYTNYKGLDPRHKRLTPYIRKTCQVCRGTFQYTGIARDRFISESDRFAGG